ncbi:Transcription initiation factor TFIID subunit 4 [Merluccius polli]|uniref:Transcription initiation factor TFIID subunit 4 n=1 Tax=Merluccius polli TaxID=89951 RepID=A0AA47MT76_MERPO|nr:Transcription initiation factor TFIID subunit 4 [Merluccius polli]
MAGASDPLEDMLFNEVDEKAVSDLVGSLESQLGPQKTPAAAPYAEAKGEGAAAAGKPLSGKVRDQVGSPERPQQGHPKAGLNQEPAAHDALPGKILASTAAAATTTTSSVAAAAGGGSSGVINAGSSLQTLGAASPPPAAAAAAVSHAPGSVTLAVTPSAAASFSRATGSAAPVAPVVVAAAAPHPNVAAAASPGLQSLNGVKLANAPPAAVAVAPPQNSVISAVSAGGSNIIVSMSSQPAFTVPQSAAAAASPSASAAVTLPRLAGVSQNGVDPTKVSPLAAQGAASSAVTASQVMNHSNPLMHAKMLVPGQPNSAPPTVTGTGAGTGSTVTLAAGMKPAVNGVGQPAVTIVRHPATPVMATSIQQQRPGLVASTAAAAARTAAPQLAVRPQQQTTIQLPPGFTIPPGMVLVRTETGQLVMVPQQVLAQAQAKSQQGQTVSNISPRPATPTAGATIRVSAPSPVPGTTQTVRLASPSQPRMVQSGSPSPSVVQAITVAPAGAGVSGKMSTPPPKPGTVITAGGHALAKPVGVQPSLAMASGTPVTPVTPVAPRTAVVSQEMQENVKKCKNFLATLIKLASHNSPSPDTSKNVKALVQDLLDAKIEPEEFTSRLQAELKSSPQPYLIPFLKKSLPALRQSLLNNQQSLLASGNAPTQVSPAATSTIRARLPTGPTVTTVRTPTPLTNTTTLGVRRPPTQAVQTRMPMVITQTIRTPGAVVRAPSIIAGKSPVNLAAQSNQKKLSDPGGGTFRDDDDINDVASMAGVNLNEENARILATSSELVGTKIRSCKDEAFLPTGLLHRRILDTAKKLGVTEVPGEVVNYISHATQSRLRSLLEKVSAVAQHRGEGGKDEEWAEQSSDVRAQLRFFEQLERMEKQRKDEQEREILLKAAKSRARQEDPEQARLKAKAKEMQQQEQAQIRQRDANLTALAAIGPRKKRKMDSPGSSNAGAEVASSSGSGSSPGSSSRQQLRQRITRVNLRDFIFCLEQERTTSRSLLLYKALLK